MAWRRRWWRKNKKQEETEEEEEGHELNQTQNNTRQHTNNLNANITHIQTHSRGLARGTPLLHIVYGVPFSVSAARSPSTSCIVGLRPTCWWWWCGWWHDTAHALHIRLSDTYRLKGRYSLGCLEAICSEEYYLIIHSTFPLAALVSAARGLTVVSYD